jgi:hypothetical protein
LVSIEQALGLNTDHGFKNYIRRMLPEVHAHIKESADNGIRTFEDSAFVEKRQSNVSMRNLLTYKILRFN